MSRARLTSAHHMSTQNKQTDVTSLGQVRANTRGISGQLPQAEAPDPDKLETTGSLAL